MATPDRRTTFGEDFRRFFGRGLAVLLPSVLTLWLLWTAFVFVFDRVAVPINRLLRWGALEVAPLVVPAEPAKQPLWYHVTQADRQAFIRSREGQTFRDAPPARVEGEVRALKFREFWNSHWYLEAAGLVVAILLIYFAGMLLGGLIGRKIYLRLEIWISRVPGFKQIYPHVKQLVELIMGEKPMAFKRVVLVEYPRKGIWTLGLVTSASLRAVTEQTRGAAITVFIPSTPTPFTGFTINVPANEVVDVPISIDEALRFVLTGGVLVPERQATAPLDAAAQALQARIAATAALGSGRADQPATPAGAGTGGGA
jgi:uncharacterized membrane protein